MIYLCIRQTTDWADEAAFRAQLPPLYAPTVQLWNDTFNIPYHLFRHRVRQIAADTSPETMPVVLAVSTTARVEV